MAGSSGNSVSVFSQITAEQSRAGVAGAGQCSSKLAVIILTFARSSHSPL